MSFDKESSSGGWKDWAKINQPGQDEAEDEEWRKPASAIVSPQIRPAIPAYFPAS